MRWLGLVGLGSVLAACLAAFAFGGSAGGAAAYALVDPNGGSPLLVADHTSGFAAVGVGPFGPGDYCLTPAPGVNVDAAAVASVEAFYSDTFGIAAVRYPTSGPACPKGQLEVKTFTNDPSIELSDEIGFTVNIP